MFCVSSSPTVVRACSETEFILDFEANEVEGILVVGQVGPNAATGRLIEVPVGSFNRLDGEFDAGAAVPHVDVKNGERSTG